MSLSSLPAASSYSPSSAVGYPSDPIPAAARTPSTSGASSIRSSNPQVEAPKSESKTALLGERKGCWQAIRDFFVALWQKLVACCKRTPPSKPGSPLALLELLRETGRRFTTSKKDRENDSLFTEAEAILETLPGAIVTEFDKSTLKRDLQFIRANGSNPAVMHACHYGFQQNLKKCIERAK